MPRSSRIGVRATLFDLGIRFLEHLKDTFLLRPVELFLSGPFGRGECGPNIVYGWPTIPGRFV
jgi:hypothetical protein